MNGTSIRTGSLERKLGKARFAIERFQHRMVRDPGGGLVPLGTALTEIARLRAGIGHDQSLGSRLHDKISGFQRFLAGALPLLDGGVLFWFLVGVLNVDLRRFDFLMLIAAMLAVLGTIAVAAWNAALGRRLQVAKNDTGGVIWDAVDGVERIMLGLTAVVSLLVGAMMYVRVADEVYQATGVAGSATAVVISLTLAVAIVVLNLYVLHLAFADGSHLTRRADGLARTVAPHIRRNEREQRRVDGLVEQIRQVHGAPSTQQFALSAEEGATYRAR